MFQFGTIFLFWNINFSVKGHFLEQLLLKPPPLAGHPQRKTETIVRRRNDSTFTNSNHHLERLRTATLSEGYLRRKMMAACVSSMIGVQVPNYRMESRETGFPRLERWWFWWHWRTDHGTTVFDQLQLLIKQRLLRRPKSQKSLSGSFFSTALLLLDPTIRQICFRFEILRKWLRWIWFAAKVLKAFAIPSLLKCLRLQLGRNGSRKHIF